jgi:hypothetical protein
MPPPRPRAIRRPDRRLAALLSAFSALVIANNIGSVIAPSLVKRSPELLIVLSARIRHLLFAVPAGIGPVPYAVLGYVRLLVAAIVLFLLGQSYGERTFQWFDKQLGGERPATLRWIERGVDRVAWLLIVLMPGSNIVAFLVGKRGMTTRRFLALISMGIVVRLAWVWAAAKQFEDELKRLLDWIDKYQWYLVAAFFAITLAQSARQSSRLERQRRSIEAPPPPDHDPDRGSEP